MKTPKVSKPTPDDVLNLDNDNVFTLHTTDLRIRKLLDDTIDYLSEDFAFLLNEGQMHVFSGIEKQAYIVIKITKESTDA